MDICPPRLHDFNSQLINVDKRLDPWEISGKFKEHDLYWSIVLGYLFPKLELGVEEFNNVLELFTDQKPPKDKIQKLLKNFNPFRQRFQYFDDELIALVDAFKIKVLQNCKNTEDGIIASACSILSCEIHVISVRSSDLKIRAFSGSPITDYKDEITLYKNLKFGFGLSRERGEELQKQALEKILRSLHPDPRKRAVQSLVDVPSLRTNSAIALLTSKKLNDLKTLFSLPINIINQLTYAGMNLDPLHKVNGKSAFYYAILHDTAETLHLLYNYATKAFQWTGSNPRNPNQQIVEIMKGLRTVLSETKDLYSTLWEKKKPSCIIHIDEIIQFNEFQLNLCEKLLQCPPSVIRRSHAFCSLDEIKRRKATLCTVLNEYGYYFNKDPFSKTEDKELTFDVYDKYKNYFRYLDNTAATFFFDHEFLVKDVLVLNNEEFDIIESSFIEFLCLNYLDCTELLTESDILKEQFPIKIYSSEFEYLLRKRFYEVLEKFRTQLNDTYIITENIKQCLTGKELRTLTRKPVIKDNFLLLRLKYFLNCAIQVNLDEKRETGPLVIERALQVLAECIKPDVSDSCTIIKCLLSSHFPETFVRHLIIIRNVLSHYMPKESYNRLDIEKNNRDLFQKIQSELQTILSDLSYCFIIQGLRLRQYIFEKTVKLIRLDSNSKQKTIPSARKEMLETHLKITCFYQQRLQKVMRTILLNRQDVLAKNFRNIFCWIDSHKDDQLSQNCITKGLEYKFNSIQVLLKFLLFELSGKKNCTNVFSDINPVKIDKTKENAEHVKQRLNNHVELTKEIFTSIDFPTKNINTDIDNSRESKVLEGFKQLLNGARFLLPAEIQCILSSVPQLKSRHDALNEIKQSPYRLLTLNLELSNLDLSKKKIKKLNNILKDDEERMLDDFICKNDGYLELQKFFAKEPVNEKKYGQVFKEFKIPKNTADISTPEKPKGIGALDFLLDRIGKLNTIINYKQDETCNAHDTITQILFFKGIDEPHLKIAVECLLFDCMVVVKDTNKNNKYLFGKMNGLLRGICFRDVLAHGNPLYEATVKVLDCRDEVKEIIEKVLEFISDKDIIQAMHQLRSNIGFESGTFSNLFDSFDKMEGYILRIQECKTWSKYKDVVLTQESFLQTIVEDNPCDKITADAIQKLFSSTGFSSGSVEKFVNLYRDQKDLIEKIKECERWRDYADLVDFSQKRQ